MAYECIGDSPVDWAGKSYEEIRRVGDADGSVVVVPFGSVEQHGYHMPVATDTILADAVCHEGAERVADDLPVLVTPPVWSGYSPHHLAFGGTLSLDSDTLQGLLEDVAESALPNGFDAILVVNGHGGNASLLGTVLAEIGLSNPAVEALGITYFQLAASFVEEVRESEPGGMNHGGEFETSLMLHLRPELVNEEQLAGTYGETPYAEGVRDLTEPGSLVHPYTAIEDHTESGAIGDPELASAEKGAELFDRLGDELANLLHEIHENVRSP